MWADSGAAGRGVLGMWWSVWWLRRDWLRWVERGGVGEDAVGGCMTPIVVEIVPDEIVRGESWRQWYWLCRPRWGICGVRDLSGFKLFGAFVDLVWAVKRIETVNTESEHGERWNWAYSKA